MVPFIVSILPFGTAARNDISIVVSYWVAGLSPGAGASLSFLESECVFSATVLVVTRFLLEFTISLELLLHRFFHAESVHHQFEMLEDFGCVPADIAFNCVVAEQFGQVALGGH